MNADGASKDNPRDAGCGGLIREDMRKWVHDYGMYKGLCSAFAAELWGVLKGIQLAWELGIHFLCYQIRGYPQK